MLSAVGTAVAVIIQLAPILSTAIPGFVGMVRDLINGAPDDDKAKLEALWEQTRANVAAADANWQNSAPKD